MDYKIIKAYQEQHYDRFIQEEVKNRMLREARERGNSGGEENEVRVMLRRKLVFATAILIGLLLLTVIAVAAA